MNENVVRFLVAITDFHPRSQRRGIRHLETGPALRGRLRVRDVAKSCLASSRGERAPQIAAQLGCDDQTVLDALHAFNAEGLAALTKGSSRPKRTRVAFAPDQAEHLRALAHRSPREFGLPEPAVDTGAARRCQRGRRALPNPRQRRRRSARPSSGWASAGSGQALDHQSRPGIPAKKNARDRLILLAEQHPAWALGFADEVWWSRATQPSVHSRASHEQPLHLVEQAVASSDPDPKALACYGVLLRHPRRSLPGRPVGETRSGWLRGGAALSAPSPPSFSPGVVSDWNSGGFRSGCWSGITPPGTSARPCGPGCVSTTSRSNAAARACVSWSAACRSRAGFLGSTRLNPSVQMGPRQTRHCRTDAPALDPGPCHRVCAYYGCSHETHLTIPDKVA